MVFLLLGFGDLDGSSGMDQIETMLKNKGCFTDLEPYRKWKRVEEDILKNPPEKLVLIGHSHGGVEAIKLANRLQRQGVSVQRLILLDVGRPDPIPANVDVAVHYYVDPPTLSFRKGPRSKLEPGNTHTKLIHVAVGPKGEVPGAEKVTHMNICETPAIQKLIVDQF
ncbi:MAG TPA: thioesterase domain-containing protein [Phycisphaerae bacterium]|nr:thioesterase domain-containing protein [Phycisphaerae bacterium]